MTTICKDDQHGEGLKGPLSKVLWWNTRSHPETKAGERSRHVCWQAKSAPSDAFRGLECPSKALIPHVAQAIKSELGGPLLQQDRLYHEAAHAGSSERLHLAEQSLCPASHSSIPGWLTFSAYLALSSMKFTSPVLRRPHDISSTGVGKPCMHEGSGRTLPSCRSS